MLRIAIAVVAAAFLGVFFAEPTGAAPTKTVRFSGRIVAASGRYTNLYGTVRLVLRSSGTVSQVPASTIAFALTLSGPPCKTQVIKAGRRCAPLHGTLSGDARAAPLTVPDAGRQFRLGGHGRVAPLGKVTAAGATSSLGFIASGRFPLSLRLTSPAGRVTIDAQGPPVKGFSSPF